MTIKELQDRAREKWKEVEEGSIPLIRVGAATCGLAAGAGEVIEPRSRAQQDGSASAGRLSARPRRPRR